MNSFWINTCLGLCYVKNCMTSKSHGCADAQNPFHVLLSESHEGRITDAGLSKLVDDLSATNANDHAHSLHEYAAPEQLVGAGTIMSDIFSMGTVSADWPWKKACLFEQAKRSILREQLPASVLDNQLQLLIKDC